MATIDKRGNDTYRLRVYAGFGSDGKRICHTKTVKAKSLREVEKLYSLFLSEVERGEVATDNKMTFQEYTEKWLRDYAQTNLSPKALYEYNKRLDNRILPTLGRLRMNQIKTSHIDKFLSDLQKSKRQDGKNGTLSARTVKDYHTQLRSMFQTAIDWDIIKQNPCTKAKVPKQQKKPPNSYEPEQVQQLLEALNQEDLIYQCLVLVALATSCRQGELMGLEWHHIDFEKNTLKIEQAAQYVKGKGQFIKDPKTNESNRTLTLPIFAVKILKQWELKQRENKLAVGDKWQGSDRIFTNRFGIPLKADYMSTWFPNFRLRHSLPYITFHGLRHTGATLLISEGLSIADVSKRLGHSNVNTTLGIYVHSLKKSDQIAAAKMNAIYDRIRNKAK